MFEIINSEYKIWTDEFTVWGIPGEGYQSVVYRNGQPYHGGKRYPTAVAAKAAAKRYVASRYRLEERKEKAKRARFEACK